MVGNASVPNFKEVPITRETVEGVSLPEMDNGIGPPFHRGQYVGEDNGAHLYSCLHCGEDHVQTYHTALPIYWRSESPCTGLVTPDCEKPTKPTPKPASSRPYNQVAARVIKPMYPLKTKPRKGNTF